MTSWLDILFALLGGVLLGTFYFGGLWFTVRRLPDTRHPALLTMVSFLGRMFITLAGFYFIMGSRVENLLACLVGFLLARQLLIKVLRNEKAGPALS
jgi:F1F0 ATPase subunit 2